MENNVKKGDFQAFLSLCPCVKKRYKKITAKLQLSTYYKFNIEILNFVCYNNNTAKISYFKKGNFKMYIVWPALFIVLIIIEIETLQLVSVWFAAGALASTIVVLCNGPLWLQFTVFLVVSTALLIASRPIVKKALKMGIQPTNSELDIGKSATVIEDINNSASTGRVTLNGVDWAAVSKDGSKISKDSIVIVNAVEGAKLIVSLKDSED